MMMMKRAEIDTTAPFKSVKEAVALFGEKVLAGGVYANKLKEIENNVKEYEKIPMPITIELEETKQRLEEAQEDRMLMATCLSSLQQELERTKYELQQLKQNSKNHPGIEEDFEFIEDVTKFEVKPESTSHNATSELEFQKKRYVTFANPPSVAQVMIQPCDATVLERHPSLRKKKKKALIPLIGGIFTKKKNVIHV
ncbi:WEB family protein At1g75720 isoform X2 [Lactuca sativa]|uniref:WEB family protein At1g75720 isoform X2 n=1 Tax=Lactuca sativa TaxID=4236 RepID=UPI000CAB9433|nr:WEB family protein At1g75720 isoform X2 [Lactuca sativa]